MVAKQEEVMAKGGNASFIVTASSVKKFLQQSEKSTACERLMGKARLHIPDFDNKQVKRRENQGAGAGSKIMLRGYAK